MTFAIEARKSSEGVTYRIRCSTNVKYKNFWTFANKYLTPTYEYDDFPWSYFRLNEDDTAILLAYLDVIEETIIWVEDDG
jgi:hypothetical protein